MLLPDLTQQAEALLTPIVAVSVANAWAVTRPLSRPLPISTVTQTLLMCEEGRGGDGVKNVSL